MRLSSKKWLDTLSKYNINSYKLKYLFSTDTSFTQAFGAFFRKGIKKAYVFGGSYALSAGIVFFCYAAAFSYGAQLVEDGEMEFTNVFR